MKSSTSLDNLMCHTPDPCSNEDIVILFCRSKNISADEQTANNIQ